MRRWIWIWMSAQLSLLGCQNDQPKPEVDPCLEIDCGPHGVCDEGTCLCDPGFQPLADGTTCIEFPYDPCQGILCSGLGQCQANADRAGTKQPICKCNEGAVPTPDGSDCLAPCAQVDCSPGVCQLGQDQQPLCVCPIGTVQKPDSLGCKEKDSFFYELVQEYQGQVYPFGKAWISIQPTQDGKLLEGYTSVFLAMTTDTGFGGEYHSVARFDSKDQLVEFVQDEQTRFGDKSARRRLHFLADQGADDQVVLHFESNILDQIWSSDLQCGQQVPIPWAGSYEYPTFIYDRFDPFFFFLLGKRVEFGKDPQQTVDYLLTNFVLASRIQVTVQGNSEAGTVALPDYGMEASYEAKLLKEIRLYQNWAKWRELDEASGLQLNLRPLPRNPIQHEMTPAPSADEQEIEITSADGTILSGTLTLPKQTLKPHAVLFVQSVLPSDRDQRLLTNRPMRDLAAHMALAGYASLRVDGRGVGKSQGASNAPPDRINQDLDAAYEVLATDPRFSGVVLLSHGFATPEALLAAQRHNAKGMVNLAVTGEDLVSDLLYRNTTVMRVSGTPQDLIDMFLGQSLQKLEDLRDGRDDTDYAGRSASYWKSILNVDLQDISGLVLPVLIIHGEEDIVLPSGNVQDLSHALTASGCNVQVHVLPGLTHLFTPGRIDDLWESIHLPYTMDPQVPALIVQWLDGLR